MKQYTALLTLILSTVLIASDALQDFHQLIFHNITSLDQFKRELRAMLYNNDSIKSPDYSHLIAACLQLSYQRKQQLEQELIDMGNQTRNNTKIREGLSDTAHGLWFISGIVGNMFLGYDSWWRFALLPVSRIAKTLFNERFYVFRILLTSEIITRLIGAPYFLISGQKAIRLGMYYKVHLKQQINVLNEIIQYLEKDFDPIYIH
jgi:hypothetical protein